MPNKPSRSKETSQSLSRNQMGPSLSRLTIREVGFLRACLRPYSDRRSPVGLVGLALDSTSASRLWRPIEGPFRFGVIQDRDLRFGLNYHVRTYPNAIKKMSSRNQPCGHRSRASYD